MGFREHLIEKKTTNCRHFNGIMNDCCDAGVNYDVLREGDKYNLPCLKLNLSVKKDPAKCDKFEVMTPEEAAASADETVARGDNTLLAMRAAHADAKAKNLGKGKGGADSIPCPTGCGGTLHYRVASYNGHMHAQCSTNGCVSWME